MSVNTRTHTKTKKKKRRRSCKVSCMPLHLLFSVMQSSQTQEAGLDRDRWPSQRQHIQEKAACQKADFTFYWWFPFLKGAQRTAYKPGWIQHQFWVYQLWKYSLLVKCNFYFNYSYQVKMFQFLCLKQLQETPLTFLLFRQEGEIHTATVITKTPFHKARATNKTFTMKACHKLHFFLCRGCKSFVFEPILSVITETQASPKHYKWWSCRIGKK